MRVFWTSFALNSLKEIYDYYKEFASIQVAKNIKNSILSTTSQLSTHPLSGTREELLKNFNEDYRYIIRGNYKVIYKIKDKDIYITDVFDTRQNPDKIKNQS